MVIDKWTRNSNNNNSCLSIPLLGHKSKDMFADLKKKYESLKSLNQTFKKYSKNAPQKGLDNLSNFPEVGNDLNIANYIDKINSIFLSINELLSEHKNYKNEDSDDALSKEISSIVCKILLEYDLFLENIEEIKDNMKGKQLKNKYISNNTSFKEIKKIVEKINKIFKKDNHEEIPIRNHTFKRYLDRGQLNFFTNKREYNNSVIFSKNDLHYSIEEEGLSNEVRLILFFMFILFALFICYICII